MFEAKELHASAPANFLYIISKGASGFKVMLLETIRCDECISTIQHCNIVSNSYDTVPTLQHFFSLKIVVVNCLM